MTERDSRLRIDIPFPQAQRTNWRAVLRCGHERADRAAPDLGIDCDSRWGREGGGDRAKAPLQDVRQAGCKGVAMQHVDHLEALSDRDDIRLEARPGSDA